jgi:hypothetical protein
MDSDACNLGIVFEIQLDLRLQERCLMKYFRDAYSTSQQTRVLHLAVPNAENHKLIYETLIEQDFLHLA